MFNQNLVNEKRKKENRKFNLKNAFILLGVCMAFIIPNDVFAMSGDIAPAETMQIHDMQMLYEQRFMQEQDTDYDDLKKGKARYWKTNKTSEEKTKELTQQIEQQIQHKQQQVAAPSRRSEFVEENGQLRIKYY